MPTILVTGGAGQIGTELGRHAWPAGVVLLRPDRTALDLTDQRQLDAYLADNPVDAIINTAAYTAVDKAETDIAAAWASNAGAAALLTAASARAGIPLVHVSTDYVFPGDADGFYAETDPVRPTGIYATSKLGGEIAVRSGNPRSVVLRTAWVLSAHRTNFLKTMLRLGATNPVLRVVDDQHGCPTSAADIADALARITLAMIADPEAPTGIFHFVNAGDATWCGLAREIFARAAEHGVPAPQVVPVSTAEYPTPARRPANSRLATARIQADYAIVPRPWQAAIRDIVAELMATQPHEKVN